MANDRTPTSNTSNTRASQPTSGAQESPPGEVAPAPDSEGIQPAGTRALKGVSAPLWWIEKRVLEPIATWLSNLAFLQILEYLGKLAIVVAVITWIAQSGAQEMEAAGVQKPWPSSRLIYPTSWSSTLSIQTA